MSAKWTFWAWEQPVKTAPKKLALLQLANNANDDGVSWYSIGKMSASCGVSERTFQRHIQELESDGLLHVERRSNRPSKYTLKEKVEVVLHGLGCQSDVAGCQSVTSGGVRVSPDLNSNPNTDLNSFNNVCVSAFEIFWNAGMRKQNKKGALKAFTSLCKKCKSENTPDEIANLMALDVKRRIELEQFGFDRLHPATYINSERWTDEQLQESNAINNSQGRSTNPMAGTTAALAAREARINQRNGQVDMTMVEGSRVIPHKMD